MEVRRTRWGQWEDEGRDLIRENALTEIGSALDGKALEVLRDFSVQLGCGQQGRGGNLCGDKEGRGEGNEHRSSVHPYCKPWIVVVVVVVVVSRIVVLVPDVSRGTFLQDMISAVSGFGRFL